MSGAYTGPMNARRAAPRLALFAVMILLAALFLFPFAFMLASSFKPDEQIFADLQNLRAVLPVGAVSTENYADVVVESGILRYALNSLIVTVMSVVLGLVVNSMAAFALTRLEWRGKQAVTGFLVVLLIIPLEAIAVPMMTLVARLPYVGFGPDGLALYGSWLNTHHVQVLPFVASAFTIFLFAQFFRTIPKDFDEAAYVDGATPLQVYWRIIVPLSRPVFATAAIILGLAAWNQYLWPVITVPGQEARPLMVGLQQFFRFQTEWGKIMAYSTLATIPVFVAFVAFQRWFVRSVMGSGVKG